MKIKFSNEEQIKKFLISTWNLKSDVMLKQNKMAQVDGKSVVGVFSLNYNEPIEIEIVVKDENEIEEYLNMLKDLGIVM